MNQTKNVDAVPGESMPDVAKKYIYKKDSITQDFHALISTIEDINEFSGIKIFGIIGRTIFISSRKYDHARIATTQINYELSTDSFPPTFREGNREQLKKKITSLLELAKSNQVNIVCLPELCMDREWIDSIRDNYSNMIIIAGSYYHSGQNICEILINNHKTIEPQKKILPSYFEEPDLGDGMVSGEQAVNIYETEFGKFAILICRDFLKWGGNLGDDIDLILVPSYNMGVERFHEKAHMCIYDSPHYIIISNTALYGGASIFGQLSDKYFDKLVSLGCKDKTDNSFKICEFKAGEEGLIFADFNLIYKAIMIPQPASPNPSRRSISNVKKIPILNPSKSVSNIGPSMHGSQLHGT